jgi:phytol kinase
MILEINVGHEIILAAGFTAAFGLMFLAAEIIYAKMKLHAEITRKFIHITCGVIAMFVPYFRPHLYTIVILGIFFTLLTYYLLRKGLLPSVHAVERKSIGSVLFPVGIVLCVLFGIQDDFKVYFFVPMGIMIFSDTIAALVGMNFPLRKYSISGYTKSIGGSLGFLVSALLICYGCCHYFIPGIGTQKLVLTSLALGAVTTLAEMVGTNGWDDIAVPVSGFAVLWMAGPYA